MAILELGWDDRLPASFTGGAVTVGNFDGVHRGHQSLVSRTRLWADRVSGPAVALTFHPPPAALLAPQFDKSPPLTTLAERAHGLMQAGADHVVILKTELGLLALSPEAFFEEVIQRQFQARAVVEGFNFRFGHQRRGDNDTLRSLCRQAGLGFEEVPPVEVRGEPVSSSRIRSALVSGTVELVRELLGRPYSLTGTVVPGAQRGRTLGFPTANLVSVSTLIPRDGVYAVRATIHGIEVIGAANIGPNPTFGDSTRKIEVHLLDFQGDLYGSSLTLEFHRRLRDIRTFRGANDLVEQLKSDVSQTRSIFDPLRQRAEQVLRLEASENLGLDGTQIEVLSVDQGIVSARLGAVCASCPGSLTVVVASLEQALRQSIPELEILEVIP